MEGRRGRIVREGGNEGEKGKGKRRLEEGERGRGGERERALDQSCFFGADESGQRSVFQERGKKQVAHGDRDSEGRGWGGAERGEWRSCSRGSCLLWDDNTAFLHLCLSLCPPF